jgi:hypothetical protein
MRFGSGLGSIALGLVLMAAFVPPADAQDMSCYLASGGMEEAAQRPSPLGQTVISMNDESALLCYGRPSAKGRTVMGELVPFGQPWRIGANEATALHLPFAAEVGGVELEAGSYSLYAVPGAEEWTFTINSNYERWGVPINDEVKAADVGSFTRSVKATDDSVEQLTVSWHSHGEGTGHLVIQWENTSVEIPVHGSGM